MGLSRERQRQLRCFRILWRCKASYSRFRRRSDDYRALASNILREELYGTLRTGSDGAAELAPPPCRNQGLTSAVGSTWIPTALRLVLHLTQAVHLPKGELIIQAEVSLSTIVLEPSSTTDAQTSPLANRTPCTARPKRSNRTPCAY